MNTKALLTLILFAALVCLSLPSRGQARTLIHPPGNDRQAEVRWQFDTRQDRDGNPNTRVYLVVDGRRVFIKREMSQFGVLDRTDYSGRDVPATALAACTGWWAGSGSEMYVLRRGRQLIVYIRYLEEQTELGKYQRLKVIPLGRR